MSVRCEHLSLPSKRSNAVRMHTRLQYTCASGSLCTQKFLVLGGHRAQRCLDISAVVVVGSLGILTNSLRLRFLSETTHSKLDPSPNLALNLTNHGRKRGLACPLVVGRTTQLTAILEPLEYIRCLNLLCQLLTPITSSQVSIDGSPEFSCTRICSRKLCVVFLFRSSLSIIFDIFRSPVLPGFWALMSSTSSSTQGTTSVGVCLESDSSECETTQAQI